MVSRAALLWALLLTAAPGVNAFPKDAEDGLPNTAAPSRVSAALPDPAEVLRRSLEPSAASYEGRVSLEIFSGGRKSSKEMSVRFSRGRYRREILDGSGKAVLTVVSDGKTEWIYDKAKNRVRQGEPADPYSKRLGPDEEYDLLASNYEVVLSSAEPVAGRAVWLLDLRSRSDGKVRRRLWVDQERGLALRSLILRPDGTPASSLSFERVGFPRAQEESLFRFSPPPGAALLKRPELDYLALDEARTSGMEPRTPGWLPSGYVFESLNLMAHGKKNIIHYRFSDGIDALSLFQCPPRSRLAFGPKAGKRVRVGPVKGTLALTQEGAVLGWSSSGSRFVLVGALSPEALRRVAESVK